MPDLPSRRDRERELATAILILWQQFGTRVGGFSLDSIPWEEFRQRIATSVEIAGVLENVFLESAAQLAAEKGILLDESRLLEEARRWARTYLPFLAEELVKNLRQQVERSGERDVLGAIQKILAEERAITIAITEVTRSISLGEVLVAGWYMLQAGQEIEPRWFTELDGRVCDVCGPLHGTGKEVWGLMFPYGPGAHPRCRCWLEWKAKV